MLIALAFFLFTQFSLAGIPMDNDFYQDEARSKKCSSVYDVIDVGYGLCGDSNESASEAELNLNTRLSELVKTCFEKPGDVELANVTQSINKKEVECWLGCPGGSKDKTHFTNCGIVKASK